MASKEKKILLVLRSSSFFYSFASVVEAFLERGFSVRVLFDKFGEALLPSERFQALAKLQEKFPDKLTYALAQKRKDRWKNIVLHVRVLKSNRTFLKTPLLLTADYYKRRYFAKLPHRVQKIFHRPFARRIVGSSWFGALLCLAERLIPPDAAIKKEIKDFAPDAVICSPVCRYFLSADTEYLKAARALGIPTALPMLKWDTLTTKGAIFILPDRLLVWNDIQEHEAQFFQNIPKEKIRIIGAPIFDNWFSALVPSMMREEFSRRFGLTQGAPFVVYLGASNNSARDERWLVEALREALDRNPLTKNVGLVVRPHPGNFDIYENFSMKGVAVVPKRSTLPATDEALQLFFDTLYFSLGTVGVTTSAMIDAMIAGKSVMAVLAERYRVTQVGTENFKQLLTMGAVETFTRPEDFPALVAALLRGEDARRTAREAFVRRLIRPRGLETPAGEILAREVLALLAECARNAP